MKLLGASLLCLGLMMAEKAKEQRPRSGTPDRCPLPTSPQKPGIPLPTSILVHLSPLILPTPSSHQS